MDNFNQADLNFAGPDADTRRQLGRRFRTKADLYYYMIDIVVSQNNFQTFLLTSSGIILGYPFAKKIRDSSSVHATDPEWQKEVLQAV